MSNIDATLSERGTRYGDFVTHSEITQRLKDVMRDTPNWGLLSADQKEALDMTAHKIGRILNGDPNYHDSWHDIVGYNRLVEQRLAPDQTPTQPTEEQMKQVVNEEHPTCLVCGKAHPKAVTSFFVELDIGEGDELAAESPAAAHFRRVIESQILAEIFRGAQPKRAAGL